MKLETKLFWGTFGYCSVVALFVQFIFLPYLMPQLHAGHGILGVPNQLGDLIAFHEWAVENAKNYLAHGWSGLDWNQFGGRHTLVWALVYAHTVMEPYVLIPVQALLFAIATTMLFQILCLFTENKRWALYGCLPFILFPSASFFYTQTHREAMSILGFILFVWFWIKIFDPRYLETKRISRVLKLSLAFMFSLGLFLLSREKIIDIVYFVGLLMMTPAFVLISGYRIVTRQQKFTTAVFAAALFVPLLSLQKSAAVSIGAEPTRHVDHRYDQAITLAKTIPPEAKKIEVATKSISRPPPKKHPRPTLVPTPPKQRVVDTTPVVVYWVPEFKRAEGVVVYNSAVGPKPYTPPPIPPLIWEKNPHLSVWLDRRFFLLNLIRYSYLTTEPYAHTSVGIEYAPKNVTETLLYMPRAMFYGLFLPFPRHWSLKGASGASIPMRLVGAFEMLTLYFLFPFLLYFTWVSRRNLSYWVAFAWCNLLILAFGYMCTNAGTLHRVRYGFAMMLLGMSVVGFMHFKKYALPAISHWFKMQYQKWLVGLKSAPLKHA